MARSPKASLSKGMKIRFSADQKAAISILAKRAYLSDSTFVRQLVHLHLMDNDADYAQIIRNRIAAIPK